MKHIWQLPVYDITSVIKSNMHMSQQKFKMLLQQVMHTFISISFSSIICWSLLFESSFSWNKRSRSALEADSWRFKSDTVFWYPSICFVARVRSFKEMKIKCNVQSLILLMRETWDQSWFDAEGSWKNNEPVCTAFALCLFLNGLWMTADFVR